MKPQNYVIASDLLPEELLHKLSKLLGGRSAALWVPSRASLNRKKRDDYIAAMRRQGRSAVEIAGLLCLSVRQVRRILAITGAADGGPDCTNRDVRKTTETP